MEGEYKKLNKEIDSSNSGKVVAVSLSEKHTFSKEKQQSIKLVEGLGVEGDAHYGSTVKHRSRVAQNPNQPNLRQVHLIHNELFQEVADRFTIEPGQMGENITTVGINLLELPTDTILYIGKSAIVKVTGLRNPCAQIDNFKPGLLKAVLDKDADDNLIRKAGIMGIILQSGEVKPGDAIRVELPTKPFKKLERV
jgi:MOSC domain-containing protein YiiM